MVWFRLVSYACLRPALQAHNTAESIRTIMHSTGHPSSLYRRLTFAKRGRRNSCRYTFCSIANVKLNIKHKIHTPVKSLKSNRGLTSDCYHLKTVTSVACLMANDTIIPTEDRPPLQVGPRSEGQMSRVCPQLPARTYAYYTPLSISFGGTCLSSSA